MVRFSLAGKIGSAAIAGLAKLSSRRAIGMVVGLNMAIGWKQFLITISRTIVTYHRKTEIFVGDRLYNCPNLIVSINRSCEQCAIYLE